MVDEGPTGVKAPDGGWGWAVLFGCFVITGFSYAFPKAVSVFFKELMREFGIGYSDTAWISSILLAMLYGTGEGGLTPGPRPGLCWQILPGAGARVWPGSATGPSARSPGTLEGSPRGRILLGSNMFSTGPTQAGCEVHPGPCPNGSAVFINSPRGQGCPEPFLKRWLFLHCRDHGAQQVALACHSALRSGTGPQRAPVPRGGRGGVGRGGRLQTGSSVGWRGQSWLQA